MQWWALLVSRGKLRTLAAGESTLQDIQACYHPNHEQPIVCPVRKGCWERLTHGLVPLNVYSTETPDA